MLHLKLLKFVYKIVIASELGWILVVFSGIITLSFNFCDILTTFILKCVLRARLHFAALYCSAEYGQYWQCRRGAGATTVKSRRFLPCSCHPHLKFERSWLREAYLCCDLHLGTSTSSQPNTTVCHEGKRLASQVQFSSACPGHDFNTDSYS